MAIVAYRGDPTSKTSLSCWLSPGCQDFLTGSAATKVVPKSVEDGSQLYRGMLPQTATAVSRHATAGEQ